MRIQYRYPHPFGGLGPRLLDDRRAGPRSARRSAASAGFVLTDHGPGMPGGTHPWHFGNLRILPATHPRRTLLFGRRSQHHRHGRARSTCKAICARQAGLRIGRPPRGFASSPGAASENTAGHGRGDSQPAGRRHIASGQPACPRRPARSGQGGCRLSERRSRSTTARSRIRKGSAETVRLASRGCALRKALLSSAEATRTTGAMSAAFRTALDIIEYRRHTARTRCSTPRYGDSSSSSRGRKAARTHSCQSA
ncbi:MAG: hypothetical protein MZU95_10335 [Desulfomicrobium escambiense]|nr:hypothetical protein [Desulfomicrobium escambiense]